MNKKSKLILAVITARGGSKGVPMKSIKELCGKPLIAYTIETSKKSKLITELIVSTDNKEIKDISERYGAAVPFMRPDELSGDKVPHLPVMKHAIEFMEEKSGVTYDYVVILQPTSPFRTVDDLDGTIEKLIKTEADSAVSIVRLEGDEHPIKAKKLEGNFVRSFCIEEPEGVRRQDLEPAYRRSGAVYAMRRNLLMRDNKLYGEKIAGYVVPRERSIDIDSMEDWNLAERMIVKLKEGGYEF